LSVIAGIIVKNDIHDNDLTNRVNLLKNSIWNRCDTDPDYKNHILHELEMSKAITHKIKKLKFEYNKVFKNKHIYNLTYDIMSTIIDETDLTIISACVSENVLESLETQELCFILQKQLINVLMELHLKGKQKTSLDYRSLILYQTL